MTIHHASDYGFSTAGQLPASTARTLEQNAQTLQANLGALASSDAAFAASLLAAFHRGRVSEKQAQWIEKLAQRSTGAPRVEPVDVGSMEGLLAIFDKAAEHLKRPAIVAMSPVGQIKLSLAGPNSREPGTINVAEKGRFGEAKFYGRITRDGKFKARDTSTPELVEYLKAFAKEPARMAALHGHQTGACCFCTKELTDPRSVAVGYGPICASHFSLPWGEIEAGH